MVKYNTAVKYGMIQHNETAILLQYRPTKRNDVFWFTRNQHQIHYILQCPSAKCSSLCMGYMQWWGKCFKINTTDEKRIDIDIYIVIRHKFISFLADLIFSFGLLTVTIVSCMYANR